MGDILIIDDNVEVSEDFRNILKISNIEERYKAIINYVSDLEALLYDMHEKESEMSDRSDLEKIEDIMEIEPFRTWLKNHDEQFKYVDPDSYQGGV